MRGLHPANAVRHVRTAACALLAATAVAVAAVPPAGATPWRGHPDRTIVRHVVRAGETASGLAVRYHAWTAELIRLNRLRGGEVRRGQVLRIPVVVSARRRADAAQRVPRPRPPRRAARPQDRGNRPAGLMHATTPRPRGWLHADLSRAEVRRLVSGVARHYDVPRLLALAVAWQESGWQQRRVSSTGALGVMQVMPGTGRWMRWYAGRPLRLRDTHDNVRAGVLALKVLGSMTKRENNAVAAYYQGLGNVRRYGWFRDTKRYVASVRAIERHLKRTGEPS